LPASSATAAGFLSGFNFVVMNQSCHAAIPE
jgi:hypothetical protein